MPEFVLRAGRDVMPPSEAWGYAATWGSGNSCGFYGFDERFHVQSEEHRTYCLEHMEGNRAHVVANLDDYDADELAKLDSFVRALKAAPVEGEESTPPVGADAWATLTPFARGYVEALFFTDNSPGIMADEWREMEARGEEIPEGSFPGDMGVNDLAPEALARIVSDCARFETAAAPILAEAYKRGYEVEQAGRDFHYSRNGHGVGFFDRKELRQTPQLVDALEALADSYGMLDSYWGDDSLVYV